MNMLAKKMPQFLVDFHGAEVSTSPFRHLHVAELVPDGTADALLTWLESVTYWQATKGEFYDIADFHVSPDIVDDQVANGFFSSENMTNIATAVEALFGTKFAPEFQVSAGRFGPGDGVGIHTDYAADPVKYGANFFTHRLLIYLNRGWMVENGGILGLFGSNDPADLVRAFAPVHGSAVAMAMGQRSFHAVSDLTGGLRYSLACSFRTLDLAYQED